MVRLPWFNSGTAKVMDDLCTPCPMPVWQEFLPSMADEYRAEVTHGRCCHNHGTHVRYESVYYNNNILHCVSAANVQSLRNVLNAAARIILRKRKFDHITTDVRDRLHWLPIQQRIDYKVCVLVYKCLHQSASTYLTELCSLISELANHGHLHSAAHGDRVVSRCRTTRYGRRHFAVSGPILWNSLPLSVHAPSLIPTQFCALLKTVLFCRAYGTLT